MGSGRRKGVAFHLFGKSRSAPYAQPFGNDSAEYWGISAKMLATFLLTMRGTPYWYAGDEIGMSNIKFKCIEDYNDIIPKTFINK